MLSNKVILIDNKPFCFVFTNTPVFGQIEPIIVPFWSTVSSIIFFKIRERTEVINVSPNDKWCMITSLTSGLSLQKVCTSQSTNAMSYFYTTGCLRVCVEGVFIQDRFQMPIEDT